MKLFTTSVSALILTSALAVAEVKTVAHTMDAAHQPMGVRAGSFLVIPKVDLDAVYNDNIYATENNAESDIVATVRPEITVKSNWNRHSVAAVARAEVNRYSSNDDENTENFFVGADGRADVLRDTSIGGGVAFEQNHEERGNPNSIGTATEPTQVNITTAKLGAFRELGRLNARADTQVKDFDYKNGRTSAGAAINNSVRDRKHYTNSVRVGYKFTPQVEAYTKGEIENRVYGVKTPTNRSSTGGSLVAGAVFDITGKTKADVFAGVARRNFNTGFKDISEPTYGAAVSWNPSELTTVQAGIARTIEETTTGGSSGYVATNYSTSVQHAFKRNVMARAGLNYITNDYQGTAASQREDEVIEANVGAKYYFNRSWSLGPEYRYTTRDSSVNGGGFDRNAMMLRLTATY